jgi:Na+-driven multidrug efflux pump
MILASGIKGAAIATLVTNFWDSIVGAIVLKSYCRKECNK